MGTLEISLLYEELMDKDSKQIYQFKISLLGIRPTIWRRIQVPASHTMSNLHNAIQGSSGRTDKNRDFRFELACNP